MKAFGYSNARVGWYYAKLVMVMSSVGIALGWIESSTYGTAVLVALAATAVSAALVRRRLERLDLISVLKTRE